jgi:hypothetical protein
MNAGYLKITAPTAYFGPATKAALAAWQKDKGISPAVGYFGPISRAAIGGAPSVPGTGPVVVPAGTDLQVTLASDSPSARTIGSGTAFNPALKLNLSAGSKAVNISSLKFMKGGFLATTNLNGVEVVDTLGNRYGNVVTSVNADNSILITFGTNPISIAAGAMKQIVVRFNLVRGAFTGTINFSLDSVSSIVADTTVISGAFPIVGSIMNIVDGSSSLASTTLDVLALSSSTLNVDEMSEQDMTKFRIREVSSNEAVKLYKLVLYNYGSTGDSDFKDVQLVDQTGTVLATAQPMNKWISFDLSAAPFLIDKGLTKDFTVRAKLVSGSNRTIRLVVYNNYDVDLRGVSTGISVIPAAGTNDASFPIGDLANLQTIGTGSLSFNRDASSPSTAVVPGASNVVLAKYYVKPTGEPIELRQVAFGVVQTGTALTGTVYVKVNDQTVYSAAASSFIASGTPVNTVTLSSYPTLAAGVNSYITVETSIPSTATSSNSYMVNDFNLIQVKRLITNDLTAPTTAATDGLTLSVQAAAMTITTLSVPTAQSVVAGSNQVELARIQLSTQAGGEDVRVSAITLTDTLTGGATTYGGITNLTLWDGNTQITTTNSTVTNGATTAFTFQNQLLVTRTTPVVLSVKGDVLSVATSLLHTFNFTGATNITAYGKDTGNSLTTTNLTISGGGQVMTVASAGTLSLSNVSGAGASPSTDQLVSVGTTNGTYFAFKAASQIELQKITSLKITATSTGSTGLATTTLQNVRIYEGNSATPIYPSTAWTCASGQCSATWGSASTDNILSAPVPTTGVTLYVKADIGIGGQADLGNSFKFVIASTTTDVAVKGATSATTTATISGTPAATGLTYVVPFRVTVDGYSPTAAAQVGLPAGQSIGVFKITNGGGATVYASTSPFTIAKSGGASASSSFDLYASVSNGSPADSSVTWATSSNAGGATGASSSIPFTLIASEANRTIPGSSYRYVTVKTSAASTNNDVYQLAVAALGNMVFYVTEADLGYSGNPSVDADLTDTVYGLYMEGIPSLAAVTAKT